MHGLTALNIEIDDRPRSYCKTLYSNRQLSKGPNPSQILLKLHNVVRLEPTELALS